MDDKTFKVYQAIGNNFGISADEVGRIIESALIQATEEIKSYGIKNVKTPIHISQVSIPSLNERVRIYAENNNK
jgi:hypothetical protein